MENGRRSFLRALRLAPIAIPMAASAAAAPQYIGGVVSSMGLGIVGERGPEMVLSRSQVVKLEMAMPSKDMIRQWADDLQAEIGRSEVGSLDFHGG